MLDGRLVSNRNIKFGQLGTTSLKNLSLSCPVFQNSSSPSSLYSCTADEIETKPETKIQTNQTAREGEPSLPNPR